MKKKHKHKYSKAGLEWASWGTNEPFRSESARICECGKIKGVKSRETKHHFGYYEYPK